MEACLRAALVPQARRAWRPLARRALSTQAPSEATASYVADMVKKQDYEGFMVGLLMPKAKRRPYYALRAFNIEVATIKDQVPRSAQQAGRIRFQFWREVLSSIQHSGSLPAHINQPVALELLNAVTAHNLQGRWLERCIESRESDLLSSGKCEDYDELETLAEKAHSSLLYLNLQLLGLQDDEQIQFAASHIGVGVGIATLLRGYAHNASLGSLCIPQKVMKQFNLSTKVALSGPSNDEERASLKNATHDMASQAYAQLEAGKKILKQHNGRGLVALLPAVSSVLYLQALEENDFDAFLTSLKYQHEPPLRFLWSLVKARYRGSF